jgi:hypothetical protein
VAGFVFSKLAAHKTMSRNNKNPFLSEEFYDDVFKCVKEKSDAEYHRKKKTFYNCPICKGKVCEADRFDHEFKHVLHQPLKYRIERSFSKALPVILFWGLWILLVWWLMARTDNTPDLNAPIDPATEIMECTGAGGNSYPC